MALKRVGRMGINNPQQRARTVQQASGLPGPIQNFSATVTGSTTASLSWSAPQIPGEGSISTYIVEITPSGGSALITGTTASITGLSANTSYTFKVIPQNSLGRGVARISDSQTTLGFNEATGGTITTFSSGGLNYKRHTFTSTASFVVTSASNPFTVFAVGGGGGGGGGGTADVGYPGYPGGSGGAFNKTNVTIPVGTVAATVGNGGAGSNWYQRATNGQNSSLGTFLVCGGGGGGHFASNSGTAWRGSPQAGNVGSEGGTSTGGTGGGDTTGTTNPAPAVLTAKGLSTSIGAGGGGSGQGGGTGGTGQKGIVVIDYQIA